MRMSTLAEMIKRVAISRADYAASKDDLEAKKQAFIDEHADEYQSLEFLRDMVTKEEARLKAAVLEATPEERGEVAKFVGVRKKTTLTYSTDSALLWIAQNEYTELVTLKKTAFEGVARRLKPDFVEITEGQQATIAKDLSGAV